MKSESYYLDLFGKLGAIFKGSHFVYSKGGRGEDYVAKDLFGTYPQAEEMVHGLCEEIFNFRPEIICGPELWGSLFAFGVYLDYIKHYDASARFCPIEKNHEAKDGEPSFILRRGYDKLIKGKKITLIEDVLNTGGSAAESAWAVEQCGGKVIIVAALCNRGKVTAEKLGVPAVVSLVNVDMEVLTEEECKKRGPCSRNIPVRTDYGH